jgi:hypothetical protein
MTKKGISFALMDQEDEIDFIPLEEVVSVDEMCSAEEVEESQSLPAGQSNRRMSAMRPMLAGMVLTSRSKLFSSGKPTNNPDAESSEQENNENTSRLVVNTFQIATVPNGYNSGRSYYLQADTSQVKQQLISQLQELAKVARRKAEGKTWFRRIQERVRAVYVHWLFQSCAALLIVAVRCRPAPYHPHV